MAFNPEQSNKISMLDNDDGSVSPDFSQDIWRFDCVIRILLLSNAWIMSSLINQKYRAAITIFIIKFKYYFSLITHQGSINTT